jgi:hypothetical protein
MTEKEVTRFVKEAADLFGWLRYHTHRSDFSPAGWPDEVLCRPPRVVIAELKGEHGKVSERQAEWLDQLGECPGVEVYLWSPVDVDSGRIIEILR